MQVSRTTPSLQALHVFVTVVDAGSIREAAERLHRTESAVSHQLRTLERQLDAPLIERLRRGIRPTALGARYAERLGGPVADIERATQQLFEPATRRSMSLTLSPVLASLWLVPRLAEFEAITATLEETSGNRRRAAELLGISERTLRYRLADMRELAEAA